MPAASSSQAASAPFRRAASRSRAPTQHEGSRLHYRVKDPDALPRARPRHPRRRRLGARLDARARRQGAQRRSRAPPQRISRRARIGRSGSWSCARPGRSISSKARCSPSSRPDGALSGVHVRGPDGVTRAVALDHLLVFWGLHPKLGPIAEWGLALNQQDHQRRCRALPDERRRAFLRSATSTTIPARRSSSCPGFHEAALAAFAVREHLRPGEKVHLQYTTTSPLLQKRLGVSDESAARADPRALSA